MAALLLTVQDTGLQLLFRLNALKNWRKGLCFKAVAIEASVWQYLGAVASKRLP